LFSSWPVFVWPEANDAQAAALATTTCAGWGYAGARPLGADIIENNPPPLVAMLRRHYQCLGSPGAAPVEH
jgi:hypothetical protein